LIGGLRRTHLHFLLAGAALVVARPAVPGSLVGAGLVVVGLALRLWAAGVLEKGGRLCTDGPYRFVRHPLYLGSLLAALGFCTMTNSAWGWLLILPGFVALYLAQISLEEQRLRQQFGESYFEYARQVPMLLPGLRARSRDGRRWLLRQALLNREHYHAVMTCTLVALFFLRPYWPRV